MSLTPEQIDEMLAAAHSALIRRFVQELKLQGLEQMLPFCYSHFTQNFRRKQHHLMVEVLFRPEDRKVPKGHLVIGDSYPAQVMFEASLLFLPGSEPEVLKGVDRKEWTNFRLESEFVPNEAWQDEFSM